MIVEIPDRYRAESGTRESPAVKGIVGSRFVSPP